MFVPFHLLKTYIMNLPLFFISSFTLPSTGKTMETTIRAHIYTRGGEFWQISIFAKLLEANISCFAKIRWMRSLFTKLLELLNLFS
jgi:hypothetical protein